ncbi:MAG: CPBP family intramembrane metalloprotease [Cellvibrionaceae bacterium]|nr:CPBP family intramembrane metalloprotease [Cellvibrionaceae bacterium]
MNALRQSLHPKNIVNALDRIDNEAPSYTLSRKQALRRVFTTLACVSVCLLIIHYAKYSTTLHALLRDLAVAQGLDKNYWLLQLKKTQFFELLNYCWWTAWHVIGYVLLPFFIIKWRFKERFLDMGWRFNDTATHWRGYVLLISPILFFIFLVSFRDDFLRHYPFYDIAHRSWFDFLAWELLYLIQFICLEFFFRGFFINALRPAIGANAVWVMCVPYLMIHFPKLWLEATGAILFGLFLGILALQSRSIWGGFMVHAGIAVSMDLVSLIKQNRIPTQWWPF